MTRTCSHCLAPLGFKNSHAEFCSTRCRVAAYRARKAVAVPARMREAGRWVRVAPDKRPLTIGGAQASVSDAATWSSHELARASRQGRGMGFVLNGDGIGCLDLDHCVEGGEVAGWAQEILDANPNTFTELSMSGTGLHVWGLLEASPGRRIRDGRSLEVYSRGRYVALGSRFRGSPLTLEPLVIP